MRLPGIVTNVTAFGAFVDIGVHQDGLIHVSQLADRFVKEPAQVVKVHQRVQVTVVEVDLVRRRIGLSMKSQAKAGAAGAPGTGPAERRWSPERSSARPRGENQKPATDWFSLALEKAKREAARKR
jgi:uncharacterized protein